MVIPGSKTTISDLEHLRAQGWDHDLHAYVRRGGRVLGICAGYQMLGQDGARSTRHRGIDTARPGHGTARYRNDDERRRNACAKYRGEETDKRHASTATKCTSAFPRQRDATPDGAIRRRLARRRRQRQRPCGRMPRARPLQLIRVSRGAAGVTRRPLLSEDHAASVDAALDEVRRRSSGRSTSPA